MKKNRLMFLIVSVILSSCVERNSDKKQYDFEIIFTNGDTLNSSYIGSGENFFNLKNGDLTTDGFRKTLVSGVRSYRVLLITKIGKLSKKEMESNYCGCDSRSDLKLKTDDFN